MRKRIPPDVAEKSYELWDMTLFDMESRAAGALRDFFSMRRITGDDREKMVFWARRAHRYCLKLSQRYPVKYPEGHEFSEEWAEEVLTRGNPSKEEAVGQ